MGNRTIVTDVGPEAEANNIIPDITVKWGTLVEGIGQTFAGIAKMLTALDPHMSQTIAEMVADEQIRLDKEAKKEEDVITVRATAPDEAQKTMPPNNIGAPTKEATGNQVDHSIFDKGSSSSVSISLDDLTKVIVQKIRQDRSNNEKIGQILKTYGVGKVNALKPEQYEAFLNELAQL